jgi:hypothetical protein
VKVAEEVEHVEVLDFCIRLMQIPTSHVMTENTFTVTVIPDNCTVPKTQFNVQFGSRNHAITRHQPLCAVDHPVISILSAKHTFSIYANSTFMLLLNSSLNPFTAHETKSSTSATKIAVTM